MKGVWVCMYQGWRLQEPEAWGYERHRCSEEEEGILKDLKETLK